MALTGRQTSLKLPSGLWKVASYDWERPRSPHICGFEFGGRVCRKLASPHYCPLRVEAFLFVYSRVALVEGSEALTTPPPPRWCLRWIQKFYGIVVFDEDKQEEFFSPLH